MGKKYIIFAGVNGAGKSTFFAEYKESLKNIKRVNSDEILRESNGDWRDSNAQGMAMKEAVRRINYYFEQGISFNQETTLTGHSILNNIKRAKRLGYVVEMHYVGLENPEIAVKRVNERVKCGGHRILESDIRRRYSQSLQNLKKVIPICDKVFVYDNTFYFERVAVYEGGKQFLLNNKCKWLKTLTMPQKTNLQIDDMDLEK